MYCTLEATLPSQTGPHTGFSEGFSPHADWQNDRSDAGVAGCLLSEPPLEAVGYLTGMKMQQTVARHGGSPQRADVPFAHLAVPILLPSLPPGKRGAGANPQGYIRVPTCRPSGGRACHCESWEWSASWPRRFCSTRQTTVRPVPAQKCRVDHMVLGQGHGGFLCLRHQKEAMRGTPPCRVETCSTLTVSCNKSTMYYPSSGRRHLHTYSLILGGDGAIKPDG
jgi:hypothetical protein